MFEVKDGERLNQRQVLLVDDVVTTGATLNACIELLTNGFSPKISILTLAYTFSIKIFSR